MLRFRPTGQFDKDMKTVAKRGLDLDLLDDVLERLRRGERLPQRFKDHILVGK
jgi:mRNA interferase YafQ